MSKKKNNNGKKKDDNNNSLSTILIILGVILLLVAAGLFVYFSMFSDNTKKDEKELAFTQLITEINESKIEKLEMTTGSNSLTVTYKQEGDYGDKEEEKDRQKLVSVPSIQAFMELIQEKVDKEHLDIELVQKPVNPVLKAIESIFGMIPTLLLIGLIVAMYKMQGIGDKEKIYGGEENKKTGVMFKDVAGLDEEKNELVEIVDFLKKAKRILRYGS